ncbi:MAG: acyl carrier protein [Clostridiales bacterium]|jgi:acyl carrier protein|nr:acyl carrier protein [Clostridiales bacterium]
MLEKLKKIISEQLDVPEDSITLETSFAKDLKADSLDLFQIIMELEEEYDVEFPPDGAEKIKTVGDACDYLTKVMK